MQKLKELSIDHVIVEVKSSMWGLIESRVQVRNFRNGTYDVNYIPHVPGPHRAQVEVGGHLIQDTKSVKVLRISWKRRWKIYSTTWSSCFKHRAGYLLWHFEASDPRIYTGRRADSRVRQWRNKRWQVVPPDIHGARKESKVRVCGKQWQQQSAVFWLEDWKFVKKFGSEGGGHEQFNGPCGISIDQKDRVIVNDWNNHRVQVFSSDGKFLFKFRDAGNDRLIHPRFALYHDKRNAS